MRVGSSIEGAVDEVLQCWVAGLPSIFAGAVDVANGCCATKTKPPVELTSISSDQEIWQPQLDSSAVLHPPFG